MRKTDSLKSISWVFLIMLLGKLLSLVANQAYLSFFGADNEQLNIFSWALQIPNYLFQSLGTALSSVVIPLFAALCVQEKRQEANRFGSNLITVSTLLTLGLVAVGMALSGLLPGLTDFRDKGYAAMALRLLMPVMLFYSLSFIYQGILQSLGRFTAAALVNLPSGVVTLLYVATLAGRFGVTGLLLAVVLGLALQALILIPFARKAGFRYRPVLDLSDGSIRTAGKMTVPIILGASAYQFNMFFNNTMMTNVAPGSVTLFNFVQTLILSSVMTLVLAITSVEYPRLTAHAASGDMAGFRESLSATVRGLLFLLLPITGGLICLGRPLLTLISLHGRVVPENITTEYHFLCMYCLCIVFLGLKEIADRAFYSLQTTRISALVGVVIMGINIVLGFILSKFTPMAANGIPFAYSVAVILGTSFLLLRLRRRVGAFGGDILATLWKTGLATVLMCAAVVLCFRALSGRAGDSLLWRLVLVGLPTLLGMIVYFLLTWLLRARPIREFREQYLHRKRGKA